MRGIVHSMFPPISSIFDGSFDRTAGSPFAIGDWPVSIAFDPAGKFAYVAHESSHVVSAYTIDSSTGRWTAIAGSPFPVGTEPQSIAVDPTGKFAYVVNMFSNDVSAYNINPTTGALSGVAGSPFAAGGSPESVATVRVKSEL